MSSEPSGSVPFSRALTPNLLALPLHFWPLSPALAGNEGAPDRIERSVLLVPAIIDEAHVRARPSGAEGAVLEQVHAVAARREASDHALHQHPRRSVGRVPELHHRSASA